jgi:predicted NBD/HSP70 family sugar kinase
MNVVLDIGGHTTLIGYFDNDHLVKVDKLITPLNIDKLLNEIINKVANNSTTISKGLVGLRNNRGFLKLSDRSVSPIDQVLKNLEKAIQIPFICQDKIILATNYEINHFQNLKDQKILYLSLGHQVDYCLFNGLKFQKKGDSSLALSKNKSYTDINQLISGPALVANHHQQARDLKSSDSWIGYCRDLAQLINNLQSQYEFQTVILGGSIGKYFSLFKDQINTEITRYNLPIITQPTIIQASKPFYNVLYGGNLFLNH